MAEQKQNPLEAFKNSLTDPMEQYRFQVFWDYYRETFKQAKPNDVVRKLTAEQLINRWKRARFLGLNFDGVQVFFDWKFGFDFSYIGMKNLVLQKYPNAKFDINVVYKDDELTYQKTEEGVKYTFTPKDPFAFPVLDKNETNVKGAFGYIKCNDESGTEVFITLTIESILEMEGMSKSKANWAKWADQMIIKSTIKRMTKQLRFDERIQQAMEIDNELYGADFSNPEDPHQTTFDEAEAVLNSMPMIPEQATNDADLEEILQNVEVKEESN